MRCSCDRIRKLQRMTVSRHDSYPYRSDQFDDRWEVVEYDDDDDDDDDDDSCRIRVQLKIQGLVYDAGADDSVVHHYRCGDGT